METENKAVLISIKPKWCELIANGEKTIEVRKTKPKLKPPFKCYIYCTKSTQSDQLWVLSENERKENFGLSAICANLNATAEICHANGKVIGEFVCNKIEYFNSAASEFACSVAPSDIPCTLPMSEEKALETCYKQGCLSTDDVISYFGDEDYKVYFWHISDLKIYDWAKAICQFNYPHYKDCYMSCCECKYGEYAPETDEYLCIREVNRPPRSWCYVEEVK